MSFLVAKANKELRKSIHIFLDPLKLNLTQKILLTTKGKNVMHYHSRFIVNSFDSFYFKQTIAPIMLEKVNKTLFK